MGAGRSEAERRASERVVRVNASAGVLRKFCASVVPSRGDSVAAGGVVTAAAPVGVGSGRAMPRPDPGGAFRREKANLGLPAPLVAFDPFSSF